MNSDSDDNPIKRSSDLDRAFKDDTIWSASDKEFKEFLKTLNTQGIPNVRVQHRAVIRALTIHFIQLSKMIEAQKRSNQITQLWFMILAIGSLVVGIIALFV